MTDSHTLLHVLFGVGYQEDSTAISNRRDGAAVFPILGPALIAIAISLGG